MPNATWLADALRFADLTVEETSDWKTRGRTSDGGLLDVRALVCHHTAGPKTGDRPSLPVVINGRPGLAGPLAQLFLARSGVWVVVAAGKSNSNGQVSSVDFSNAHTINVEAEAAGVGSVKAPDDWPSVQYNSYAKGMAALALHLKFGSGKVLGHKEIAYPKGRKIDPSFDMGVFRGLVDRYLDQLREKAGRDNPRPAPHAPAFRLGRYLKRSDPGDPLMHGVDVQQVQKALVRMGHALKHSRRVDGSYDGIFGNDMHGAVIAFQKRKSLAADGIVGPRTATALGGVWTGPRT